MPTVKADNEQPFVATRTPARFIRGRFGNAADGRSYKLFVPEVVRDELLPLVVMLHGCHQKPDDFASATRMNELAERERCLVVYPSQSRSANRAGCWNWYAPSNQRRGQGEPAIIAGITRSIIASYPVDPKRVYVAGLSAGGAMAAIMGMTYPDLYAAVGIHSGLPYGAAHDLLSAYDAMLYGTDLKTSESPHETMLPTIVFHGDRDTTVHPSNADRILAQAAQPVHHPEAQAQEGYVEVVLPEPPDFGRHAYTRTIRCNQRRKAYAEQWLVHGAGHAWSGGHAGGSFVDPKGPDASQEMLRFFATARQYCKCC
ncbi:extracellular catalytic domain type 1 short-chain-length polyhydroxyalkanoate depolymerase [Noviherbaspirillum massiliense]|uniref:extracellular catalytic domain type 1 short-chain-length polyhydroxyalkanoate depolymerase n=1 Tax=Noviherbaspirillum massiliense TaxID=1465823 RepID=UPI0002E84E31|nr:PHB depolymerase family esterase [Noviherbaspirillum massiliense]